MTILFHTWSSVTCYSVFAYCKITVFLWSFLIVKFTWLQGIPVGVHYSFRFFPIHCTPGVYSWLANILQASPEVFLFHFGVFPN